MNKGIIKQLEEISDMGFKQWLKDPLTQIALSMLPASDPPELTTKMLEAAYKSGAQCGASGILAAAVKDRLGE